MESGDAGLRQSKRGDAGDRWREGDVGHGGLLRHGINEKCRPGKQFKILVLLPAGGGLG